MLFNVTYSEKYQMDYAQEGKGITIAKYKGDAGEVRIPDTIEGLPVLKIEAYAFAEKKMKYIFFPDSLEVIDHHAFSDCRQLTRVLLPQKIRSVGNYAFYNCWEVEMVHLPASIKNIGFGAFKNCEKLTDVIQEKVEGRDISIGSILDDLSQQIHVTMRHIHEDGGVEEAKVIFTEHDYDAGSFTAAWNKQYEFSAIGSGKYMRYCISSKDIDYFKYDSMFYVLLRGDSFDTIITVAIERLMFPYKLQAEPTRIYSEYILEHCLDAVKKFMIDDTIDKVAYMLDHDLLTEEACDQAIDLAAMHGKTEYTAMLMDYRHRRFTSYEDEDFDL